jgi:hypothetical protein
MIDLLYIAVNYAKAVILLFLIIAFGGIFAWSINQNDTLLNIFGVVMLLAIVPITLLLIGNSLWPKKEKESRE